MEKMGIFIPFEGQFQVEPLAPIGKLSSEHLLESCGSGVPEAMLI